jgi:hypothetical protein
MRIVTVSSPVNWDTVDLTTNEDGTFTVDGFGDNIHKESTYEW